MKSSASNLGLYILPRRERDPMGVVFPSIGIVIWLGAASCWLAAEQTARPLAYQASLGRPLFAYLYSPFDVITWAIKFDHPARFGFGVHHVFVHAYLVIVCGHILGVAIGALMAGRRFARLQHHTD